MVRNSLTLIIFGSTNCGKNLSSLISGVSDTTPASAKSILEKYKFFKTGTFYDVHGSVDRRTEPGINVTTRLPIVYALVAGGQCILDCTLEKQYRDTRR